MTIPTEPIGSIPGPKALINAGEARADFMDPPRDALYDEAILDPISRFEATGSPVITDDCGFSPFSDGASTTRSALAARALGVA